MGLFGLFKRKSSSSAAKERLMMVLAYERKGLPPNFAELLQKDMVEVFSKYHQFDAQNIEVEIKSESNQDELWISIPFSKTRFE